MQARILIVDDDRDYLEVMSSKLLASGFKEIRIEEDSIKAASLVEKGELFDVALIDRGMEGMDGIALLEFIKNTSPGTECIMVTAYNDVRVAVECLKKGAYDYLVKPVTQEDLVFAINRSLERKRLLDILDIEKGKITPALKYAIPFQTIVTQSANMLRVLKAAELHADSNVPILITGESGTGKELLARAIHDASPRSKELFTPINMAALTGNLFEAEFFGHTKGAFTGAEKDRTGFLKSANNGTLFLDEIGNLPLELQAKLLRVLQDGEFTMLGTSKRQKVDVRFIAATNEDLDLLLARKKFRKDLYYRIRGGWLHLPPLKERKEDIPLLINTFLQKHFSDAGIHPIKPEAMDVLMEYGYPGNVRELQSIILSSLNLAQGKPISIRDLPDELQKLKTAARSHRNPDMEPVVSLCSVEKSHILKIYSRTGKNKSKTARLLGIGLNTLRRKLLCYGVD